CPRLTGGGGAPPPAPPSAPPGQPSGATPRPPSTPPHGSQATRPAPWSSSCSGPAACGRPAPNPVLCTGYFTLERDPVNRTDPAPGTTCREEHEQSDQGTRAGA